MANSTSILIGMSFGAAITTGIFGGLFVVGSCISGGTSGMSLFDSWRSLFGRRTRRRRRSMDRGWLGFGESLDEIDGSPENEPENEPAKSMTSNQDRGGLRENESKETKTSQDIDHGSVSKKRVIQSDGWTLIAMPNQSLSSSTTLVIQATPSLPSLPPSPTTRDHSPQSNEITIVGKQQCQECLDSITRALSQQSSNSSTSWTWNHIYRITAHLIKDHCSIDTFRSTLQDHWMKYWTARNGENGVTSGTHLNQTVVKVEDYIMISIVYVQELAYEGQCVQLEVLSSR